MAGRLLGREGQSRSQGNLRDLDRGGQGTLRELEKTAEIAYLRERNRDATGVDLERQMAYCSQLPPFWRNLYGGLFGLILLVTVLNLSGHGDPKAWFGRSPPVTQIADGRNVTKAAILDIPTAAVDDRKFVKREGASLVLDGRPFFFAGFNNYYMMTRAADSGTRKEVLQTFQKARELGLTVLRMWAFADGPYEWNALQPELELLDDRVLREGLDWVVDQAREYGMRLVLTLTNGDPGYGGMPQYAKWHDFDTVTGFYTLPAVKESFKRVVATLITRRNHWNDLYYRDDPTIMGWELANEPHMPGDDSGNVLKEWIDEMAAFVKKLDPNHLVSVGLIGWYGASTPSRLAFNPPSDNVQSPLASWHHPFDAACLGTDFVQQQASPYIDFMSVHMYPDSWLVCSDECKLDWAQRWVRIFGTGVAQVTAVFNDLHIPVLQLRAHFEDALKLGKPLVLGEFGKQHYSSMAVRRDFTARIYGEVEAWNAKHGNVAGTLLWMLAADTYPDYDGYTLYTTKGAAARPQPRWPDQDAATMQEVRGRKAFMNWSAMMECTARRATNAPASAGAKPWVRGWDATLSLIEANVKAVGGIALQKQSRTRV